MFKKMREVYAYREMIFSLVKRDLKGRYKGSVLGFLWTFINPLLQLVIYTMVFSAIMRSGKQDYYLFLFVALVPWLFFSTSVSAGANVIWAQKDMVKKIYFPREILPISFVTSQFINMLLSFIIVFGALLVSHYTLNFYALFWLPLIMIIEYLLALGMAFIFSAVTVYLRDVEYILSLITMAWQFLTPIMYAVEDVPQEYQTFFYLNPMTQVIISYRDILY
ncbi:MAG: ABC transporter permease, partial [Lachnospiraceae bacterium]|nr:ABC transporter permease [Lachnospiraceae bacterium]